MQFTRQNVLDAYGASRIDEEAEARDCSADQVILDLAKRLGLDGQFTLAKVTQYQQGRRLLDRATLILSEPVKPCTPAATLAREGLALATGGVIEVPGLQEGTVQYVGLTGDRWGIWPASADDWDKSLRCAHSRRLKKRGGGKEEWKRKPRQR